MILETIMICDKNAEKIINDYFNQFKAIFSINKIRKIEIREEESCYYEVYLNKENKQIKWKKYFNTLAKIFDENNYNKTKIYEMWLSKIDYYNDNDNLAIIKVKIKNDI